MPEGFDHDARSIDTDRRNQDWQVQTCGTECSKPFAATLVGTDQADRLKKTRLYIHLYGGRAIFLTRCAWAIPTRFFRVRADALDRDGAGARPHTRHGQLPSTPLTASVLRDIEGGVPVEADHILGDLLPRACVAADNRPLVHIANADAKAYEARRARNRAAVASAAPSSHPRGRHMSDREPSTKPQKLRQLPALYRAFAGRAANLAIGEASPAQGGSSRLGTSRVVQGVPRRLLAAKRPDGLPGESDVPSRRGASPVAAGQK